MKKRILACALVTLLLLVTACGGPIPNDSSGSREPSGAPARPAPTSTSTAPADEESPAGNVSTFALDVDTASYGYARGKLRQGLRPDPADVRTEEFVNAFRQGYAEPEGDGFAVHLDGARGVTEGSALLRVGLQTKATDAAGRRPANLTFVVDVSGSMGEPGRLDLVRDALHTLVDQLGPGDRVSIVSFSDEARLRLSMTPAARRDELHAAIDQLQVEGSTNLEKGLVTAYREADRAFRPVATNRVVLLSDGLANTGDTSWTGILNRVRDHAARRVTLLCVGVGQEYGDALMEQLADKGDGAAIYVATPEEAREAFTQRLPANLDLRARDAKAQVAFNPAVVASYRLVGYENRALSTEDFRDDAKDGGEVGPGHAVTALYALTLRPGASGQLAMATVRWLDPDTRAPAEAAQAIDLAELSGGLWSGTSPRFQVDVVAAAFAQRLREADGAMFGEELDGLAGHASRLAAETEDPMVAELATLIRAARSLD
ncbi:vWA domain-containing protein [Sphaerisporangium aureirubrum]|uniref:von Willebrand factor type A domain-containing protein n=1 Tax=Sphaerisporangium aureirubrum TaxID=1544736 RepID=A0ABW1NAM1_9ACTN